ncbi:MAG: hypothetical protein DRJ38_00430 [Thermoprotei archaeon]|nr:MAG: hypothetical protein DRJ38_00430 [Thermoprotei archaeon]
MKGIRYKGGFYNALKQALEETGDSMESHAKHLSQAVTVLCDGDWERCKAMAEFLSNLVIYTFSLGVYFGLKHPDKASVEEVEE